MGRDPDPVDRDSYDAEESVQMDILLEEWERFLDESIVPFPLIPRDFHGVLDEKSLNNVMNPGWMGNYRSAVEHEYPDLKDLYAEQLYTKYSTSLYYFFKKMFPEKGTKIKTISGTSWNVQKDPRAEIGQNDKYFWDIFMRHVDKAAIENVWDLFDYQVALVSAHRFNLHFEQDGKAYRVAKDGNYRAFINQPIVQLADRLTDRVTNGTVSHTGDGFVAVFVNGSDIVKSIAEGRGSITSNTVCVGIHDWSSGAGTVQMIHNDLVLDFSSAYVDDPEYGVMRHKPGLKARHNPRKKVV